MTKVNGPNEVSLHSRKFATMAEGQLMVAVSKLVDTGLCANRPQHHASWKPSAIGVELNKRFNIPYFGMNSWRIRIQLENTYIIIRGKRRIRKEGNRALNTQAKTLDGRAAATGLCSIHQPPHVTSTTSTSAITSGQGTFSRRRKYGTLSFANGLLNNDTLMLIFNRNSIPRRIYNALRPDRNFLSAKGRLGY